MIGVLSWGDTGVRTSVPHLLIVRIDIVRRRFVLSTALVIIRYSSTFYVEMGQVQNGHLYLRYGNCSVITTAS